MSNQSQLLPPVSKCHPRAIELGCASGAFLLTLESAGYRAEGVELVPEAAELARSLGFPVRTGELTEAGFKEAEFDAVFAWMVIEHIPDVRTTLAEIKRILIPGGWFCFSVPNYGSVERSILGSWWKGYDLPRHLHHFRPDRLRRLLQEMGFIHVQVIHQSSVANWTGSLGARLTERNPESRLGKLLLKWFYESPPFWVAVLILAPLGKCLAAVRQSGRLTIMARKPESTGGVQ